MKFGVMELATAVVVEVSVSVAALVTAAAVLALVKKLATWR